MELKNLSSNWRKLQAALKAESNQPAISTNTSSAPPPRGVKRKRTTEPAITKNRKHLMATNVPVRENSKVSMSQNGADSNYRSPANNRVELVNEGLSPTALAGKYVALDCEMVGVGPNPDQDSALARASIVNYDGDQVYDSYVQPKEQVTDWRTPWSGITSKHMLVARSFEEVQKDIARLLEGKILVGHAVSNDLAALYLSHPKRDIRDTSKHPPFRRISAGGGPKLKLLASEFLGIEIQGGAHSSVEDARACMLLFQREKDAFEKEHAKKWPIQQSPAGNATGATASKKRPKKKKKKKRR